MSGKGDVSNKNNEISAKEILDLYPKLAIPDFQRGLVWSYDDIAALLESLFYGIPCGSILIWKPKSSVPMVPLANFYNQQGSDDDYLIIIDGQQRIRSIYYAWNDKGMPDDEDPGKDKVWAVYLPAYLEIRSKQEPRLEWLSQLVANLEKTHKNTRLFRWITDPLKAEDTSKYRHNYIPFKFLRKCGECSLEKIKEYINLIRIPDTKQIDNILELIRGELLNAVSNAYEKKLFFWKILEDKEYYEIVDLYNRVNSAGKRVEEEEKAYATLVSLYPKTIEYISKLFKNIHTNKDSTNDPSRDDYLQRKKENHFGFKLFIRFFIQLCNYHFGIEVNPSSMSFHIVENENFQKCMKNEERAEKLWKKAEKIIEYFGADKGLLAKLYCDDFRFMPDAISLWPVFQLLIQYPGLMEPEYKKFKKLLAELCLQLFLCEHDYRKLYKLLTKMTGKLCSKCIEEIKKYANEQTKDLDKSLEKANSLQNRYVLLLYWLLRKRGIKDFSPNSLPEGGSCSNEKTHLNEVNEINKQSTAEKQHIIPYAKLKVVYSSELMTEGRLTTHPVNNIGNLTYLSHCMNSQLEDKFFNIDAEDNDNPDNLRAHLLTDNSDDENSIRNIYKKIKDELANSDIKEIDKNKDYSEIKRLFSDFCKKRRNLIAHEFGNWMKELSDQFQNSEVEKLNSIKLEIPMFYYDEKTENFFKKFDNYGLRDLVENMHFLFTKLFRFSIRHSPARTWINYNKRYDEEKRIKSKKAIKLSVSNNNQALEVQLTYDDSHKTLLVAPENINLEEFKKNLTQDIFKTEDSKDCLKIFLRSNNDYSKFETILEKYKILQR